jgi:hypothetical protein
MKTFKATVDFGGRIDFVYTIHAETVKIATTKAMEYINRVGYDVVSYKIEEEK